MYPVEPSDVITVIHVYGAETVIAGQFAPNNAVPAPVVCVPLKRGIADKITFPVPEGVNVISRFPIPVPSSSTDIVAPPDSIRVLSA